MKDLSRQEKCERIIEFIHKNNRLPRRNEETDLYMIYSALQQSARLANEKQRKGQRLGNIAKENIYYYNQVMETLRLYKPTKIEKLELLIEFINENHRLPINRKDSNSKEETSYKDGTDMRGFYDGFMELIRKIKEKEVNKIPLEEKEIMYLGYGKIIEEMIAQYKMTTEEKVEELIEFINEHHRFPRPKHFNNGQVEVRYRDNTSMSVFQIWIASEGTRIEKKQNDLEPLTKEEQKILYFYHKIQEALKSQKMIQEEKVEELIRFIEENSRLPKFKYYNNGESEATFRDGTDMRNFYHVLTHKANEIDEKVKKNETITEQEQKELEYFNKIQEKLSTFKISREEKLELLLQFIRENNRLPRAKFSNNGIPEVIYNDGTDMNKFYSSISNSGKLAIEREKQGKTLTKKQEQNKMYYEKVQLTLDFYKKNKTSEIVKIMEYLEGLRKDKRYEEILLFCEAIIKNKNLTEEEQENLRQVFERYIEHINKEDIVKIKIKEFSPSTK